MELFVFMDFLCVCFLRKILGLWVCWRLSWLLCYGFIYSVYLWFGLVSFIYFLFSGFDGD